MNGTAAQKPPVPDLDALAVIDSLADAVIVVSPDRRVLQANRTAQQWAGIERDVTGLECHAVFPCGEPCEELARECPVPVVLDTRAAVKLTHSYLDKRTSLPRYVDVVASPLLDASGEVVAVVETMRNVTEERRMADALMRRNEHLAILNAIAATANQSLDLTEILDRALEEVLRLAAVDAGAVFLREEMVGELQLFAHRGLSENSARLVAQFGMLDGGCGGAVEYQSIVVVPDIRRYRGRRAEALLREQLSTVAHVPLVARGCSLGSMCVATRELRDFDEGEQELLNAIGNQIAVAVENARLYAELQQKERMRGELLRQVIAAQEEERRRIARELHDETSQNLTALIYAAEEAADLRRMADAREKLEQMRLLAQRTLDGVGKLIFDLRPTMLDHLGLLPALRWYTQSRLSGTATRVTVSECASVLGDCRLPPTVETALFRVAQEAISNIARHSLARNARLRMERDAERVRIYVEDDGVGFDLVQVVLSPDSARGLGLLGMRERVELLGGTLDLDSAPGHGTRIEIDVPLAGGIAHD
jgi:signal transduction histidine kinase